MNMCVERARRILPSIPQEWAPGLKARQSESQGKRASLSVVYQQTLGQQIAADERSDALASEVGFKHRHGVKGVGKFGMRQRDAYVVIASQVRLVGGGRCQHRDEFPCDQT